ncbi:hypothetical protein JOC86_004512 [Bacillus pakistanensis]|uniref:Uncharacterized protein n=1 Tax=Rossellomorea pakistanensis TaxID=992288 RepID=A0ABS2NJ95_9BACI|nr:hypothetical protein [Bacillus pakistanensis]MBM7587937.1 hypothetical protein [Bacillus pakistanensis]
MSDQIHPTELEKEFLELAFNRFYDLFDEIMVDSFWNQDASIRIYIIKEIFSVYFEILKYRPIQWIIGNERRPNFTNVGKDLMKFVRNVLFHFPFFESWDDIWIKRSIINLFSTKPQSIDRFLTSYEGKVELKYRFWEEKYKKMTYITIEFPKDYGLDNKIFLKNIISEKDGVKFSLIFMDSILKSQLDLNNNG